MLTVGIITGLQSEADCLRTISRDLNLNILVSGVSPDRAEALARRLCENQCDLLLSFGIAGALRAGIATGDLLIPASVIQSDGRVHETNAEIRARLLQRARAELPELAVIDDAILGTDTLIGRETEKLSAGAKTGAATIDMESHRIAMVAEANGLPMIIVRAVLDDVRTELPAFVKSAVTAEGTPDYAKVITGALLKPWNIKKLARLAKLNRAAHRTLRRVAPILGGVLKA